MFYDAYNGTERHTSFKNAQDVSNLRITNSVNAKEPIHTRRVTILTSPPDLKKVFQDRNAYELPHSCFEESDDRDERKIMVIVSGNAKIRDLVRRAVCSSGRCITLKELDYQPEIIHEDKPSPMSTIKVIRAPAPSVT